MSHLLDSVLTAAQRQECEANDLRLALEIAPSLDRAATCRATGNHLSAERLRELFAYDAATGFFTRLEPARGAVVGASVGHVDSKGYITLRIDGKSYRAHRLAWLYVHGGWAQELDHINRDKTDCRIANLRVATRFQNMQNAITGPKSRTGVRGVAHHPASGKFAAYISRNGKKRWLGVFLTVEEAAVVRRRAEQEAMQ